MIKRVILILVVAGFSALPAREFTGFKTEYMNSETTNFYGLGFFTSNKRFDAEVELFTATKVWESGKNDNDPTTPNFFNSDYRFWYMSFAGYLHFLRTDKMSWFGGFGIMPLFPRNYVYHYSLGMDFFFSEDFRVFYMWRFLENNAEDYKFPRGAALSVGFKWSF